MPYSLVTQPLPLPFRKLGTPSSTVAVQITRVLPSSINTLPSAWEIKSGVILMVRNWSACLPSLRIRTLVFCLHHSWNELPPRGPAHFFHGLFDRRGEQRRRRGWILELHAADIPAAHAERLR